MAPSRFIAIFSSDADHLYETAPMLSPHAEICPPNGLVLEVPVRYEQDTLNKLSYLTDKSVKIGGASTRTAAILTAKARPGTLIPYGKEREFLGPLPVRLLTLIAEIDEKILTTLSNWGIETLGELAALPKTGLATRFGQFGTMLQRAAQGEDIHQLEAFVPEQNFEETQELEWTLNSLEPLIFIMGKMLDNLCANLRSHGLAAEQIQIRLKLSNGSYHNRLLKLALPMQDPKVILSLVRLELQTHPPQEGVLGATIQVRPTKPRIFQHSLLYPTAPSPEKLSRTLTRLKTIVGEENVGCPVVLNTHRPDAFRLRRLDLETPARQNFLAKNRKEGDSEVAHASTQLSLRRLRPPQPAQIRTDQIIFCAGPWKSSGDWWGSEEDAPGWSREEWDVELTDGGIYRIYWDDQKQQWFMDGVYD